LRLAKEIGHIAADIQIAFTDRRMSETSRIAAVAASAATYWENFEHMPSSKTQLKFGLSGGRAVAELVDIVQLDDNIVHECFSLANIPTGDWHTAADTNLAVLKRRFPGDTKTPPPKPLVSIRPLGTLPFSPEMSEPEIVESREKVLKQERVMQIMHDFSECNLVFTGIGSMEDPNFQKVIKAIGMPLKTIPENVTGDIGYNFVHHDVDVVHEDDDLGKRLISVPMSHLQAISRRRDKDRVVAIAWGRLKAKPLLDACRGSLINAMVIDTELAEEMEKLIKGHYLDARLQ
jgi:hypothetical protein